MNMITQNLNIFISLKGLTDKTRANIAQTHGPLNPKYGTNCCQVLQTCLFLSTTSNLKSMNSLKIITLCLLGLLKLLLGYPTCQIGNKEY